MDTFEPGTRSPRELLTSSCPASTVIVTGCSSGIGRAVSDQLAASGARVYGGSRRPCTPQAWTYLPLDVSDERSVRSMVARVLQAEGRIDAVVACAGVAIAGAFEETTDDEARRQFDVNLLGVSRTIRAVLPAMRKQASGKLIVIGSIGGLIGLPFVPYYSASKFALDGLVEALRAEILPFGIQATIVHPGDFNTEFGRNRLPTRLASDKRSPYRDAFIRTLSFYAAQENAGPPPAAVARAVRALLVKRTLPPRVIVGTPMERLGVLAKAMLPRRVFEYVFRLAYQPKSGLGREATQ